MHRNAISAPAAVVLFAALCAAGCANNIINQPVVLPDADSVSVAQDSAAVTVGTSFTFTIAAFDSSGNPLTANLGFASSDAGVFTVNGSGRVTGVAEGTALLRVTSGAARDSAVVVVQATQRGWYVQPSGLSGVALNGVFFQSDGHTGWAVGDGGRILYSTSSGASWSNQATGTTVGLKSVWFVNATEGWVAGQAGMLLHTTNRGATWARITNLGVTDPLNGVWFATRDTGWVVGGNGTVLRTFDRGATWSHTNPTAFNLNAVSFSGTRDGWVVGDNGTMLGTHDRGLSWYVVEIGRAHV